MDIFELIKNKKRAKWIVVGVVIAVVFIFVLFPIFSKFFEETTSASVMSETAVKGTSIKDGGNNYITIKEDSEEEENLLNILSQSELWNTSIASSRQYQVLWYKTLSGYLEKTYLQELTSGSRATPNVLKKTYFTYNTCEREYDGDYSNDECDFNGPITNIHNLKYVLKDKNGNYELNEYCGTTAIYNVSQTDVTFYKSSDTKKDVGGKILGMYPDVLATITLANTYATLDQNKNTDEYKLVQQYEDIKKLWEQGKISGMPYSAVQGMMTYVKKWYEGSESAAVIQAALDDTFAEGSIYSTFDFSMGSTCKVKDVVGYYNIDKLPCVQTYDEEKKVTRNTKEYDCVEKEKIATSCYVYTNSEGETSYSIDYTETDGDTNTYYQSITNEKYCDYVWDGEDEPIQDGLCPRTKKGPFYQIQVEWICSPEKPIENITCSPIAVYDDRDKEQKNPLYYYCGDVSLSDVRTQIVDKVFDAYEKNELDFNKYMTEETVVKYTYPDSEDATDGEESKDNVLGQINPKGYLIDDDTRNIVAKHIQLEITGQTEGRSPVICDQYGNFALQSYNRVLNLLQFKDALKNTLFVKDNILRRKGELTDKNNYSEKIFGTFYSSSNTNFSNLSAQEIASQTRLDQSKKNSLIIEIFSSYEYITEYLNDEYNSVLGANGRVTGTGLARADSTGYSTRTSMPFYGTDAYNKYYSIGLYGECAWYATGRIREILATAGSSYNWTANVNGGDFCYTAQAQDFTVTGKQDYDKPQKGAVISWRGGSHGYGHVAIVEEVYYDSNGKPESVLVSEGGLNINSSVSGTYTSNYIWNHDTLANRKTQCSNGRCFTLTKLSIDQLKVRFGSYQFQCYIYLLKDGTNQSTNAADAVKNLSVDFSYSNDEKNSIINALNSKFQEADGINQKINFYNYNINTEGGRKISTSLLKDSSFLFSNLTFNKTMESSSYVYVEPGFSVGIVGGKRTANINGKTYSVNLNYGEKIPRWMALYFWAEDYLSHRSYLKNLMDNKQINISSVDSAKIIFYMKFQYIYGDSGSRARIERLLDLYKSGSDEAIWCYLSLNLIAKQNNTQYLFANYFRQAELQMNSYLGKGEIWPDYGESTFSYYTKDWVKEILDKNILGIYPNESYYDILVNSARESGPYNCKNYYNGDFTIR